MGDRVFQRHGQWKSVLAKDGYVKDDIASRISASKSLGFYLLGNCPLLQALSLASTLVFFIIRHFKIEVSRQPQTSKCHVTSRLPSGLPFAVHVSTSGDLSCGK